MKPKFSSATMLANLAKPAIREAEPEAIITVEQAAALDFEPWQHEPGEWQPPTRQEWAELETPYLVTLRIAHAFLFKSKPELMADIERMDEATGQALQENFCATIDYFEMVLAIVRGAACRIVSAGCVVELQKGEPQT